MALYRGFGAAVGPPRDAANRFLSDVESGDTAGAYGLLWAGPFDQATLPAGQTLAFIPVLVKEGTKPGGYAFRVKATATADGTTVTRYGTLTDVVKAGFGGMSNPPAEMLNQCAFGVTENPPFSSRSWIWLGVGDRRTFASSSTWSASQTFV